MQLRTTECRNREAKLILRAQSGDSRALAILLAKYKGLVDQHVRKFTYVPGHSRDDLVMLGQIGMWDAIKRYDPSKKCALTTTLYNRVRRSIGKAFSKAAGTNPESRRLREHIENPDGHENGVDFHRGHAEDPEEVVVLRDELKRMLQQVDPASAQALVYRSQGYDYADIAKMMGVDEMVVRHEVLVARRILQKCKETLRDA
jgi:RNA polymerase sigma factor (sigma-70 family)